jgi:CBS domain-containing protein
MSSAPIYRTDFPSLKGGDEVGEAMRRMLTNFVTDLPVVDDDGRLIGILKLERLLASLLPKGALIGFGMDDLSFVSDSLDHLRKQMQTVADTPVRQLMVKAEQVVHPDTSQVGACACHAGLDVRDALISLERAAGRPTHSSGRCSLAPERRREQHERRHHLQPAEQIQVSKSVNAPHRAADPTSPTKR